MPAAGAHTSAFHGSCIDIWTFRVSSYRTNSHWSFRNASVSLLGHRTANLTFNDDVIVPSINDHSSVVEFDALIR